MELKEYQENALAAFVHWREALGQARDGVDTLRENWPAAAGEIPKEALDYPRKAWKRLAESGGVARPQLPYIRRTDDAGRPIPHICFKVPTGGGKTLLAAAALERLHQQTGLVLWITPTRAIYEQTKAALRNREHPYRQMLERGSGGRVKFMEKEDPFDLADAAHQLCVMLLSLPAANNNLNREFLRMFRGAGKYRSFFSDGNEVLGDAELLEKYPDLDRAGADGPVIQSLFNAFKMLRPVVVLDEAHKAYGQRKKEDKEEFARVVSRLDPRLVIELSATPNEGISNLLVDIPGPDLVDAQMIKSPVQVFSYPEADWKVVLSEAKDRLEELDKEAVALWADSGRYIRPIAVVRVERTGKGQQESGYIHAEDARDCLIDLGVAPDAVRIKSSYTDELGQEDLLSPYSPVRWIITKSALMEGWDCSFAYLLVMLDNTQAQNAITQLVGRILRQPAARQTDRELLNQCYVYCWNTQVGAAVSQVKQGLEREGLSGLGDLVVAAATNTRQVRVERREQFRGKNFFLPLVLHREGDGWVELDYQQHIQPHIDWAALVEPDPQQSLPAPVQRQSGSVFIGDAPPIIHDSQDLYIDKTAQVAWFARRLADVMPNAWQAGRIARRLLDRLRAAGETDEAIYDRRSYLAHALRKYVKEAVEVMAEQVFREKLNRREIRFDLETGQPAFQMFAEPYEIAVPERAGLMDRNDGRQLRLSLFEPIYTSNFDSDLELSFARYLDEQKALEWWHRVAARQRGDYYLRGWKQERIWPDFIAMAGSNGGKAQLLVFETKGGHLRNPDTDYKEQVLETLQKTFNCGTMTVREGPAKGTFRLVFSEAEFPAALASLGEPDSAPNRAAFERLAEEWERERPRGVDVAEMTAHPAYQSIIAMGEAAVPGILERLAAKPDHWFVALNAITGATPVPPESRGRVKEMAAAWLEWGRQQGYGA